MVGGTLVLFGLATRPAAFIMSGEMAVAYFQVYAPKAFFPVINGGASAALFCWIFLLFLVRRRRPMEPRCAHRIIPPSIGAGEGGSMRLHLAEFLLAILFVAGGFSTLRDPKPRAAQLARLGFPFADLSVRVNATLMVVAGLALAMNYYPAAASAVLAILLIPTTVFGHAFWLEKGHERQVQLSHFIKNLGVLAGLLLVTLAAD